MIRHIHVSLALLSLAGFVLRGYWMLRESLWLRRRWVKISPHVVDTFLLLTGVALVIHHDLYPTQHAWLAMKLLALVLYIVLGSIALKRGRTRTIRATAFISALAVFVYMLMVAVTHSPVPGV